MKTMIVLSDTHGRADLAPLAPLFAENDFLVHLGDGSGDLRRYAAEIPEKVWVCKGNCDFSYGLEETVIEAEGCSLFCCHGHRYGVKTGLGRLAARARACGCSVALYGHTHCAAIDTVDGVLCINPGAAGSFTEPSYCYLVLHEGKATPVIVPIRART